MKRMALYPFTLLLLSVITWFVLFLQLRNVSNMQNLVEVSVTNSNNYVNEEYPIILHIQQPLNDFHSDHWFHMSEYFLSHMREIQSIYFAKNYASKRPFSLHIIGNTPLFSSKLSKMSLFLLMMTILNYESTEQVVSNVYIYDSFYNCDSHSTTSHCADSYKNTDNENTLCYLIAAPLKMLGVIDLTMPYSSYTYRKPEIDYNNRVLCNPLHISLGYKPVPTSKWFLDQADAALFRRKLNETCPTGPSISKKFKFVLLNRNLDRVFVNFNAAIESVVTGLPLHTRNNWETISISHDEGTEPCELKQILHNADILITSHGFQCISLLFMKEGSLLFEIFPYKYFRTTYLDLSRAFGVRHKWIQMQQPSSITRYILTLISQDTCMSSAYCRNFARRDNIYLTKNEIGTIIDTLIEYDQHQVRK